jgi:hypothetical protein
MELNTYITPSNNEFKERIRETRYMSYNDIISDEIKILMDIDIIRDLANKAMYINNQLPYDVASMTARQIYLGEPITGIEIPQIEIEEEEVVNDNEIIIEEPIIKEEIIINKDKENKKEIKEPIIEDPLDYLEKTFDLSNMLSELPMGMLDEIPMKNMLDELPLGEEQEIINQETKNNNEKNEEEFETFPMDEIQEEINLPNEHEKIDKNISFKDESNDLLDDLPSLKDMYDLDSLMGGLENTLPDNDNLIKFDTQIHKPNIDDDIIKSLSGNLTMDFYDEPIMQKVKTR